MTLHPLRLSIVWILAACLIASGPDVFAAGRQGNQAPADGQNQQQPNFSISVTVPVVNVDAIVTDDEGNFLPGLKKENFRIFEDGVPQTITNFSTGDAPITVVLLVEYSQLAYGWFVYNAINWGSVFLGQLRPSDWVALVSFDLKTHVDVDFTHNPAEIENGLSSLILPGFNEANLFDAVSETVDRLRDVKGRKSVLVLASGIDTFSSTTFPKLLNKLKETDVTINCVGVNQYGNAVSDNIEYFQSQNQLRSIAALTGGRSWFPRLDGEIPGVMQDIATGLRNQYSLSYEPTNRATNGKYRKIKIEIVGPDGAPLVLQDQKGKKHKYVVYARQGYTAPTSSVN